VCLRQMLPRRPLQAPDQAKRPPEPPNMPTSCGSPDWPASIVMVGPCDWDPPLEAPSWLEQVTGPILLVTTSSEFQDDGRLVRAALDGLANEALTVVATLPAGNTDNFDVPSNARLERFVPHSLLLDRAVCAVTHGGMGATQKALARGVPVCAVPFGRDQFEVARRVEVADVGTRLPASRLTPERLRAKVHDAVKCAGKARCSPHAPAPEATPTTTEYEPTAVALHTSSVRSARVARVASRLLQASNVRYCRTAAGLRAVAERVHQGGPWWRGPRPAAADRPG